MYSDLYCFLLDIISPTTGIRGSRCHPHHQRSTDSITPGDWYDCTSRRGYFLFCYTIGMTKPEARPRPYVGVSGVVNHKYNLPTGQTVTEPQDLFVEAYADTAGLFKTNRMLALGVKATHMTQFQSRENKYGREWYPVGDELTTALHPNRTNPNVTAVAQIYLDKNHVSNSHYRDVLVEAIATRGQQWLQAIQFDMLPWHGNEGMLRFASGVREDYDVTVILQCYKDIMDELGPKRVVQRLGRYAYGIDYILFDASHGTGQRMDARRLGDFLHEAYSSTALRHVNFAVAGGLDAQTVREDLPGLLAKYPELSWDAEAKLHPINNMAKRPLQMDITKAYLQASTDVIKKSSA